MNINTATAGCRLGSRPSLTQAMQNSLVLAYRSLLKVWHTPEQLADVVFQPIIFILVFSYVFGGAIAGSVQGYLPILIPAIWVQSLLQASAITGVQLREDMDTGVFDRFKSLPIARIAPLAGPILADIFRYTIATVSTFVIGYIIGYRPARGVESVALAALLVIGCSWGISWIFAFLGVIARTASSVQAISMLVLFPLMFFSNAFVPIETLPHWLRWFVKINPVSHIITAVRELTNVGKIGPDFIVSLVGTAVIVAIFAPITVRVYARRTT